MTSVEIKRDGVLLDFDIPEVEPADYKAHREGVAGARAPVTGAAGTVYARRCGEGGHPHLQHSVPAGPEFQGRAHASRKGLEDHLDPALQL